MVNKRPLSRRLVIALIIYACVANTAKASRMLTSTRLQVFLELERDEEQDLELLLKASSDPVRQFLFPTWRYSLTKPDRQAPCAGAKATSELH